MKPPSKPLNWKEKHLTSDEIIDAQHQELLDIANELQSALHQGRGSEILHGQLIHLIKLTQAHFAAEEREMCTNCYPGLPQHKGEHDRLIKQIMELQRKINEGQEVVSMDVIYFIKHWIMHHLVTEDYAYGLHLKHKKKYPTS
jgi:hemerythrin